MAERKNGGPVDPTANVLSLVELAVKRLDDLRVETGRRQDTEMACVKEIGNLHAKHVKEIGDMRAAHGDAMAVAESSRLNAVRLVDVLNGTMAAERAQQAVNVLAATAKTDAENLRTTLATTAASIASQNAATFGAITERLAALEKSSYEGKGKSTITDPALTQLLEKVDRLSGVQAGSAGKSAGINAVWLVLVAAVAILLPLILKFIGK